MPNTDDANRRNHFSLNEVASNHVVSSDVLSEPEQEQYFNLGADAPDRRQLPYIVENEGQAHAGYV